MELEQCREDDRQDSNTYPTIINVAGAFLAASFVFTSLIGSENKAVDELQKHGILFSVLVISSLLIYYNSRATMGILRQRYVQYLEKKLLSFYEHSQENDHVVHWTTLSSTVMTFNRKNIKKGKWPKLQARTFKLLTFFLITVFLSILGFLSFQIDWGVLEQNNRLTPIVIIFGVAFAVFLTTFLRFTYVFLQTTQKSKETLKFAYDRTNEKLEAKETPKSKEKNPNISYFILPRKNEMFSKALLAAVGLLFGYAVFCGRFSDLNVASLLFGFVAFFVTEYLFYQARYQWNDIRGIHEDNDHPENAGRRRLIFNEHFPAPIVVKQAGAVTVIRVLVAAAIILCLSCFSVESWFPLAMGAVLIFIPAVLYELARDMDSQYRSRGKTGCPKLILFMSGFGYPVRLFIGIWVAYPTLFHEIKIGNSTDTIVALCLIIAAIYFLVSNSIVWHGRRK